MSFDHLRPITCALNRPQQRLSTCQSIPPRSSVPVACCHCRLKKARCDGVRPSCTRCHELQLSCKYDVTQGISRAERFRLRKQRQTNVINTLTALVDALRSSNDLEATTLLARLRLGESVEEIVQSFSTNLHKLPENLHSCAVTPGIPSLMDCTAGALDLEPIAKPAVKIPTSSVDLDVSNRPGELSISTTTGQFLSVIFEREEFRLPAVALEVEEHSHKRSVTPVALSRAQINSSITLHGVDNSGAPLHNIHEPSPYVAIRTRIGPFNSEVDQRFRESWATYPRVRDGLATALSFDMGQTEAPSYIFPTPSKFELPLPSWALLSVNMKSGSGSMNSAFSKIHSMATSLIQRGTPQEDIFGSNPNIAALFDEEQYNGSSILSQWAASMVHSVKLKGHDFTCFASMYVFWYLMRWMISPSRETYEAIPRWLRPTPNQLFIPHIHMIDFVIWPKLREFAVSTPPMQEKMEWLMDLSTHIQCRWPFAIGEALQKDVGTSHTILTDQAKEHMATLSNWSVGPTFRAYVPNADLYVSVRPENG